MVEAPLDAVAELARRKKQEQVVEYGDDPDEELSNLRGFVAVIRNGEIVMLIYVGHGVTAARECVYWAAAMTKADELALITDGFFRFEVLPQGLTEEERKAFLAGQDLQPGDFQRAWEAGEREGLTECLWVQRLPAMGPSSLDTWPYVREGRKLTWGEKRYTKDLGGAITRHAREGYNTAREQGAMVHKMVEEIGESLGFTGPQRGVHVDRALARILSEKTSIGLVTVIADESIFVAGIERV
jgi:hypothetical protein